MKTLSFVCILFLLMGCSDASRRRVCQADSTAINCSNSNALSADSYRKVYIAEVSIDVTVSASKILFLENAQDEEADKDLTCDLSVSSGLMFNYTATTKQLTLKNAISNLTLTRSSGDGVNGIVGKWKMVDDQTKARIVTELEFIDLNHLRLTKTCYLR